jgi:hypothetical protein
MNILYVGTMGQKMQQRDVGKPHLAKFDKQLCPSTLGQAIVSKGRTQATDTLNWGRGPDNSALPALQKTRRRGCPRAPKQFWRFALLLSLPLAQRKSLKPFTLNRLFRKSQFTPANTSNLWGRAQGAFGAMPALFLSAPARIGGAA